MTKSRSISDEEISLIKAMAARGMKNKDIQFFFNRPERPVNSGRITGIKNGNYSNSSSIPASSDKALEDFLQAFKATGVSATVMVPGAGTASPPPSGPMAQETLMSMFEKDGDDVWRFRHGESEKHECKEDFGFKHSGKWLRAVAALANNRGGYIVFGVKDKKVAIGKIDPDSLKVTGLNGVDFEHADPAEFTKRIKSTFDPTPMVETAILDLEGKKVGIMYVHQHSSRPVIAQKADGDQIKEGDILFRYSGQSMRIKYSDLRSILDDRDRQAREQILPMVERLLLLGPSNAMVADLASGKLSDEKRSILIGEELLEKIKFIRKGEFDEVKGETALRLVGDVQVAAGGTGAPVHKAFVTPADLLEEFMNLSSPFDPKEYIRCAVEGGNGSWLPMQYYARKAGLSTDELGKFIMGTKAPKLRKQMYHDRAMGKLSAFHAATGQPGIFRATLETGSLPPLKNVRDAANAGRAAAGLSAKPPLDVQQMLGWLKAATTIIEGSAKRSWMSTVRRGLARIDELYYSTKGTAGGSG